MPRRICKRQRVGNVADRCKDQAKKISLDLVQYSRSNMQFSVATSVFSVMKMKQKFGKRLWDKGMQIFALHWIFLHQTTPLLELHLEIYFSEVCGIFSKLYSFPKKLHFCWKADIKMFLPSLHYLKTKWIKNIYGTYVFVTNPISSGFKSCIPP